MTKPTKYVAIPDKEHVVRYCKKNLAVWDKSRGIPIGVHAEFFYLRPPSPTRPQETYLSADYYEHFTGDCWAKLFGCLEALPIKAGKNDVLVRLSAGQIRGQGRERGLTLKVMNVRKRDRPSYASISGVPPEPDAELSALLSEYAVCELVALSAPFPP